MRIAIVSEAYPSKARPNQNAFVHARVRLYHQAGHQVCVLADPSSGEIGIEEVGGVSVVRYEAEALLHDLYGYDPEAIAFHLPYPGTAIFEMVRKVLGRFPVVAWIHGYEAMYTGLNGYHRGWSRFASLPWDMRKFWKLRGFLRQCQGVVYVSQWMRKTAEQAMLLHHPSSYVIHNPVDLDRFSFAPKRSKCEPGRRMRGIALRSLGNKYGLDIAVRAYAGLPQTDLTIVGTGPLEAALRQLIEQTQSQTEILARPIAEDELPRFLQSYDYFVAPSRAEAQGLAMCEAMACGLPVVATRVGGIPEFVRDGVDGFLVPPENPAALRDAVARLVADPVRLREMGRNVRRQMEAICAGASIAAQELDLLAAATQQQGATLVMAEQGQ